MYPLARLARTWITPAEREVWKLVACGLTTGEIATQRGVSYHTAKAQVSTLMIRTGASNRVELAMLGHIYGVVGHEEHVYVHERAAETRSFALRYGG